MLRVYIEEGNYFTINRARQYGKTTTLNALKRRFENEYMIFLISFEGIEEEVFADVGSFCVRLFGLLYDTIDFGEVEGVPEEIREELHRRSMGDPKDVNFRMLTNLLTRLCREAGKPVVLMIDEVDQAGDYQVFVTFLGCLRDMYLKRNTRPTFQSVILAGVYDIKNLKEKIRPENECSSNSPFLVSKICKLIDEAIAGNDEFAGKSESWTREGVLAAIRRLIMERNTLFESLIERFIEESGRKLFLLYLRPIINGTGNYYIESRTMSMGRTDVIVDYRGEQYITEMKVWRGKEYHNRGEKQIIGYLEDYHKKKGYMLSFCFNKKKQIGVKEIVIGNKVVIEAVV